MNEYLLLIHRDLKSNNASPSPEQMTKALKPFQEWVAGIGAKGNLVSPPKRWDTGGRFVKKGGKVFDGSYAEKNTSVGGVFLFKADSYDDAVEVAKGCPIIEYGAIVEVRLAIVA